jgi:hypothetical protein
VFLPLLIAVVGAITYALSVNPKIMTLARDMFWVGLLVFLLTDGAKLVTALH